MNEATTALETAAPAEGTPGEKLYAGKFKTTEELEKGYIEGEKFIQDRGRKANLVDSLTQRIAQEQGITEEGAFDYLASLSKGELKDLQNRAAASPNVEITASAPVERTESMSDPVARGEARRARWEMQQDKLLAAHPEASSVLDQIELEFMQTGEAPAKIFEKRYAPFIERGKQDALRSVERKNAAGVTVGVESMPAPDREAELYAYAQRTGDWKPLIKHRRGQG